MKKEYYAFIRSSLDGCSSYALFEWIFNAGIPHTQVNYTSFRNQWQQWFNKVDITKFKNVYIFDINITEYKDILDHPNVTAYFKSDNPESDTELLDGIKAKIHMASGTSVTKYVYKAIKSKVDDTELLTDARKLYIALVDDAVNNTFAHEDSRYLDTMFKNFNGDRVKDWCKRFKSGYKGFTKRELENIHDIYTKRDKLLNELEYYKCDWNGVTAICVTHDNMSYLDDITAHAVDKYDADLVCHIYMYPDRAPKVYVRRSPECKIDITKHATGYLTNIKGASYAASGIMDDDFLNLMKEAIICSQC